MIASTWAVGLRYESVRTVVPPRWSVQAEVYGWRWTRARVVVVKRPLAEKPSRCPGYCAKWKAPARISDQRVAGGDVLLLALRPAVPGQACGGLGG